MREKFRQATLGLIAYHLFYIVLGIVVLVAYALKRDSENLGTDPVIFLCVGFALIVGPIAAFIFEKPEGTQKLPEEKEKSTS